MASWLRFGQGVGNRPFHEIGMILVIHMCYINKMGFMDGALETGRY
jgi:hypothetical protein